MRARAADRTGRMALDGQSPQGPGDDVPAIRLPAAYAVEAGAALAQVPAGERIDAHEAASGS